MTKYCSNCKKEKPLEEFSNRKLSKDGKVSHCKSCMSEYQTLRRKNNPDLVNKLAMECYHANKHKWKENRKKYYLENRDYILKRQKKYLKKHGVMEKRRIVINAWTKEKCKADPSFRIRRTMSTRIWHALKGNRKSKKTELLIGCDAKTLKSYLESKFKKNMSWKNYGEWHVDHIKPCDSFDLTKESEQLQCFNYLNLQPLWKNENLVKSNKIM